MLTLQTQQNYGTFIPTSRYYIRCIRCLCSKREYSKVVTHISSGGATASTDPVPPSFTYTADAGSNALSTGGVEVIGDVSNARGIVIENDSNTVYFYYKQGSGKFQNGEGITFTDGVAKSGTISNLSNGSKEITDNFVFDDGQRDGFYDVSKITRKEEDSAPNNPIMIVMDFFTHSGSGNVFTGNSYGTMVIPRYSKLYGQTDLTQVHPLMQMVISNLQTQLTIDQLQLDY